MERQRISCEFYHRCHIAEVLLMILWCLCVETVVNVFGTVSPDNVAIVRLTMTRIRALRVSQPENASNAVFSTAIRLSSAESPGLQNCLMTKIAYIFVHQAGGCWRYPAVFRRFVCGMAALFRQRCGGGVRARCSTMRGLERAR